MASASAKTDHESRLSVVETHIANIGNSMLKIEGYLKGMSDAHTNISSKIAVIEREQDGIKKNYDDHEARIREAENYQNTQKGHAAAIAGLVSAGIAMLAAFLEHRGI